MAPPPPRPRVCAASPLECDDLLAEILLRLPSHPTRLLRASLVCRRWRRLLRDLAFLSRFRAFHRTPPVLGLYRVSPRGCRAFLPVGEPADCVPAGRFATPDPDSWFHFGCRHGRVLLRSRPGWLQFLVWDPLTGHRRCVRIQRLPRYVEACHATALGDQGGLDRRQGSFRVAFVFTGGGRASACLFSSETGAWGRLIRAEVLCSPVDSRPVALAGNALYWLLLDGGILQLHLGKQRLNFVEPPPRAQIMYPNNVQLFEAESGVLGFVGVKEYSLHLWARAVDSDGTAEWVLRKIIDLDGFAMLPVVSYLSVPVLPFQIVGVDEGGSFAFIWTALGIYMVFLNAAVGAPLFKKVSDAQLLEVVRPYSSFYVAGGVGGGEGEGDCGSIETET
ncbi:unnamed protein product [Urochloa decumbens]|uniref:F-box domain-containing protein n=1 Tax=Urochloa decumbens TaxID=240449 RepID=A0ABC8YB53_9POAL